MPITITMPALSPTMTEGTLAKWLVKEGDSVSSGDILAEIETDKATMEVEAIDEGVVGRLLVAEGTEGVAVNTPIAIVLEEGEDDSALEAAAAPAPPKAPKAELPSAKPAAPAAPATAAPAADTGKGKTPAAPADDRGRIKASPLARRMAAQAGLELSALAGSGPGGRVVKADIEAALQKGAPSPARAAEAPVRAAVTAAAAAEPFEPAFELQPLSQMRKVIAQRLTESKQTVPHFYLTVDCEIDALLALRKQLNDKADGAYRLSVNDLVIKAVAVALKRVPAANTSYTADGIKAYARADIAVAVATEHGLITPVIRDAGAKGLETISNEMKVLAEKARERKLKPEEYQGGTFSISNLGMYGIKQFEAVINPPQACILAVGAGEQRPVVKDGAVAIATVMSCTLSTDHRAVDGAIGAQFMAAFKRLVEDPVSMLL
jgi:pyruvate dehydrogenase E2 component (dihydrolipoyllysine-residue acetyltransferase)